MWPLYQQRNYYNMADGTKPKLQMRSGLSINGEKTSLPATKLLINHGKPNFTIQRSPKAQNSNDNPLSPKPVSVCHNQNNSNEFVVKRTTLNGMFRPSNVRAATKQSLPQNGSTSSNSAIDTEASKVVLRRTKVAQTEMREEKNAENVPEFILRQRRIQERLANQNILDFENRRSGYFTQVLISPSSPNRQSFGETMASPAVKPGLEISPLPTQHKEIKEETTPKEQEYDQQLEIETGKDTVLTEPIALNRQVEEEEVAKAIEEVNKAVEGEDDYKAEVEEHVKSLQQETEQNIESNVVSVNTSRYVEETKPKEEITVSEEMYEAVASVVTAVVSSAVEITRRQTPQENDHIETVFTSASLIEERRDEPKSNSFVEKHLHNGHSNEQPLESTIIISYTNGLNGVSPSSPEPNDEKGVTFQPKTTVSFSNELNSGDNKYPDIINNKQVIKDVYTPEVHDELKDFTKLKFDIKADDQDIEVKPILISETP